MYACRIIILLEGKDQPEPACANLIGDRGQLVSNESQIVLLADEIQTHIELLQLILLLPLLGRGEGRSHHGLKCPDI
jgi:hypothetical protein